MRVNNKVFFAVIICFLFYMLCLVSCAEALNEKFNLKTSGVSSDSLVYWEYIPATNLITIGSTSKTKSVSSEDLPSILGKLAKNVSFNDDVFSIKEEGFANFFVNGLDSLNIPASVSYVGASAFAGNTISNFDIPQNTNSWDISWNEGCENYSINGISTNCDYISTQKFTTEVRVIEYTFSVVSGETYTISFDDISVRPNYSYYSNDLLGIEFSVKDELGNKYIANKTSSSYISQSITTKGSKLIITVTPRYYNYVGTFELSVQSGAYGNLESMNTYEYEETTTGTFTESVQSYVYSFSVTSGENYKINWYGLTNDIDTDSGDLKVSAKDEYGNEYLPDTNPDYSASRSFTVTGSRLIVTVTPYNYGDIGTFELTLQGDSYCYLSSTTNPNTYRYNLAYNGNFTESIQSYEYIFNVTTNQNYIITWEDSYSNSTLYTCNVKVSAKDELGNKYFTDMNYSYADSQSYTLMGSRLIVTVTPTIYGDTGTFKLSVQSNSDISLLSYTNPITRKYSLKETGNFTDNIKAYEYEFYVTSGTNYIVKWDDLLEGTSLYTCNVKVSAKDVYGNVYLSDMNSGYLTLQSFTVTGSRLIVTVTPYNYDDIGTFELTLQGNSYCYLSSCTNPTVYQFNLTETGEFTEIVQSFEYRFSVTSGANYIITWDDSCDGSGLYSSDVKVSAKDESGNEYFTDMDNGYSTPRSFFAIGSNLIITVIPFSPSGTGTFELKVKSNYEIFKQ